MSIVKINHLCCFPNPNCNHSLVRPMLLLNANIKHIVNHIWSTSEGIQKIPKRFNKRKKKICILDPGGVSFVKIPYKSFYIDGIPFSIQLDKVNGTLLNIKEGTERIPGFIRFWNWLEWVILPIETAEKLTKKLEDLRRSDECLNAQLDLLDKVKDLNKHPNIDLKGLS